VLLVVLDKSAGAFSVPSKTLSYLCAARPILGLMPDENLAAHLQSPDFFDAERHPELRFVAEDVDLESQTIETSGEITIRGVAKPVEVAGTISAPITDAWGNERIGLQLSATVDRTEFGLNWNMPLPTGDQALANTVTILAELQLVKAA